MQLAYLDAGSGSLIASAVVGGGAAALVAFRSAGSKVTRVFSRKRKSADGDEPTNQSEAEQTAADGDGNGDAATESASVEGEAVKAAPSDS